MSAIILALLSIIGMFQGVPFPGPGTVGNHANANLIAVVQVCENIAGSPTNPTINIGATGNCANGGTAANPTAGHLEVIWNGLGSNIVSVTTRADTLSNSWAGGYNSTYFDAYSYSTLASGGSADTFTLTVNTTTTSAIVGLEISGANATPLDGAATYGAVTGATWTGPSITTTNANDLIIGCFVRTGADISFTAIAPFSIPFGQYAGGTFPSGACEVYKVTATGTYTPTITPGASSSGTAMTLAIKSS